MPVFIDTHCHLDAPEFGSDRSQVRARAAAAGVALCVIPAVAAAGFDTVRTLAHAHGDAYALGIHPLCTPSAREEDLQALDAALTAHRHDPRLVAVGEIGLDHFVPEAQAQADRARQAHFFDAQLRIARRHGLPVLLHVRRAVDAVFAQLRQRAEGQPWQGIAHAFNGSPQQARAYLDLGLRLGFGGAFTFDRALGLRELARSLPLEAIVLETDAPDMPPYWLYRTQAQRAQGLAQGRNEPGELPRIARELAQLRGLPVQALAEASYANALAALPGLAGLGR